MDKLYFNLEFIGGYFENLFFGWFLGDDIEFFDLSFVKKVFSVIIKNGGRGISV